MDGADRRAGLSGAERGLLGVAVFVAFALVSAALLIGPSGGASADTARDEVATGGADDETTTTTEADETTTTTSSTSTTLAAGAVDPTATTVAGAAPASPTGGGTTSGGTTSGGGTPATSPPATSPPATSPPATAAPTTTPTTNPNCSNFTGNDPSATFTVSNNTGSQVHGTGEPLEIIWIGYDCGQTVMMTNFPVGTTTGNFNTHVGTRWRARGMNTGTIYKSWTVTSSSQHINVP